MRLTQLPINCPLSSLTLELFTEVSGIKDKGFEILSYDFNSGGGGFTSIGYPQYNKGDSPTILQDINISANIHNFGQELYSVDKTFIVGSSGGPVFNKEQKVVGYIDRGSECPGDPQSVSAFCSIKPLLNLRNE